MAGKTGHLRTKDELLALALARGSTLSAAAKVAGYSERHAHRRADDPAVMARVEELRHEFIGRTCDLLRASGMEAVRTLRRLLRHGTADPVRLSAAKALLKLGVRMRDSEEIEQRLAELEERLASPEGANMARNLKSRIQRLEGRAAAIPDDPLMDDARGYLERLDDWPAEWVPDGDDIEAVRAMSRDLAAKVRAGTLRTCGELFEFFSDGVLEAMGADLAKKLDAQRVAR